MGDSLRKKGALYTGHTKAGARFKHLSQLVRSHLQAFGYLIERSRQVGVQTSALPFADIYMSKSDAPNC